MSKQYPEDWFEAIAKNAASVYHPSSWSDVSEDFIIFFDKFCAAIKNSSVLIVGTGDTEAQYSEWPRVLLSCGADSIKYIEVFEGNCRKFANREYEVIQCDIRNIDNIIEKGRFDLLLWLHGPEHVTKEDMIVVFGKIWDLTNKGFVVSCPFGNYYGSSMVGDNIYEEHLQPNMILSDFDMIGCNFLTIGEINTPKANIIGYKL